MRIVYIHQYFKTPADPGSTRSYFISLELIRAGHSVTVIGARKEGQREAVVRKTIDGIEVISIANPYSGKMSIRERARSFGRFMVRATEQLFRQRDVDLVIATSTPLTVGVPALLYNKILGVPYLFEVRDLWPEFPIQMGALRDPLLRGAALSLERQLYHNAWHIVALSPGMVEGVVRVSGRSDNVTMIPNMAKIDRFWRREKDLRLQQELGLREDTFKVIHFGAMGIANGLEYILDAASILRREGVTGVEFLFLGDGAVTDDLKRRTRDEHLDSVHFYGRVPMDQTSEIVNLCDMSVVPFRNLPILATNSPNKLFDSLSAGIPVVVNSEGWTKDLVERYECGAFVHPDRPGELARTIQRWMEDEERVALMGNNARKLAENQYDKSILCKQFAEVVGRLDA